MQVDLYNGRKMVVVAVVDLLSKTVIVVLFNVY